MNIIQEIEEVIAVLPLRKARMLRFWLNEFQAARRYNQLIAYTKATYTLADFEKNNGNALWN